jgi:hypothetical protein
MIMSGSLPTQRAGHRCVAIVAPVDTPAHFCANPVTTRAEVATVLATIKQLRLLANGHTSHKCHRPRTDYRDPIVGSVSVIGERVARSISSSIVVRVESVASRQLFQWLSRCHDDFRGGKCGKGCAAAQRSWRSRAPP